MRKEIKNLWVAALRSGNYRQGKRYLRKNDEFCCLGVLCDISEQGEWDENENYLSNISLLPPEVQEWAEMKTDAGTLKDKSHLTTLNDNGKSFEEIADIIEKHWEEL